MESNRKAVTDCSTEGPDCYLAGLASRIRALAHTRGLVIIGLAGPPGVGKSTLASVLVSELGSEPVAAYVPMDGFHLSNKQLHRQHKRRRKGAIDTFDAYGFVSLLRRIRLERDHTVYAPAYERSMGEPIAGSISIEPGTRYVITEGNYLLSETIPWVDVRKELDEAWFLDLPPDVRRQRLQARHVEYGKTPSEAEQWVSRVDEQNAKEIERTREVADFLVDMSLVKRHH